MPGFLPDVLTSPDFQANVDEKLVLGNVGRALSSARAMAEALSLSRWWIKGSPIDGVSVKTAILYRGFAVGIIELSPLDGKPLPCGFHPRIHELIVTQKELSDSVNLLASNLRIVEGVEYREREMSFAVPVAFGDFMVSHVNIYCDGIHVLPDYLVMQEMKLFGV